MYSTCIFCSASLGSNDFLEAFPVGRRLAFDARNGRLWVVCRQCERWNLSPVEERWEVIEQAERLFRGSRRRFSTPNIGLARLADGAELVRIGEPLRSEFAAWRYGDQFGRRRRRQLIATGLGVSALGITVVGGVFVGIVGSALAGYMYGLLTRIHSGRPGEVVARVRTETTGSIAVRRSDLAETRLLPGDKDLLALQLRHSKGEALLEGREALRTAAALMPHVNRYGANPRLVAAAVLALDQAGGVDGYLTQLASSAAAATALAPPGRRGGPPKPRQSSYTLAFKSGLFGLHPQERLAFEMALHEEAESRVMRGELAELERAWQDAEEIAAISDDMLLPSSLQVALHGLRRSDAS